MPTKNTGLHALLVTEIV